MTFTSASTPLALDGILDERLEFFTGEEKEEGETSAKARGEDVMALLLCVCVCDFDSQNIIFFFGCGFSWGS